MKKLSMLFAALVMCLTGFNSCKKEKKESAPASDMLVCSVNRIEGTKTIPLSELVENCTIVNFEDNDNALFRPWFTTVTDKYIGIRQSGEAGQPYKLFDRTGKFLCDVGSFGQGPGEYSIALYDDVIDDEHNMIYLASMVVKKGILVYDTSGKYVKSILQQYSFNKPKMFLSGNILSIIHMPFPKDKYFALQYDITNDKVVKELPAHASFTVQSYDGEIFRTNNTSAFDFQHTSSDTLFHYDVLNNKIKPAFIMGVNTEKKPFRQYIELNNYYITNIWDDSGKGPAITDKKTGQSSTCKIVNDFYGNMEVPLSVTSFRNGWFVWNLEPPILREKIEKHLKENNCSEEDKQKLQALLSTLPSDDDANNVAFIGKLK
ncbi:MAG: 6-bladed beta-propeller [Tannerella sp.]|nr:6-bladed beta-propeller [Tannerella sp.]